MIFVEGRLQVTPRGFGFVITGNPDEPDYFVPAAAMRDAVHGDRVSLKVKDGWAQPSRRQEGEIAKVLERGRLNWIGQFRTDRRRAFVIPDDSRFPGRIHIAKSGRGEARQSEQVVVKVIKWPTAKREAEGEIIEILGRKGQPGVDVLSIAAGHDLPLRFPPEVEKAASAIPLKISHSEIIGRTDWRDLPIVTIDGDDAKDLDDAVYVIQNEPELYRLSVHIADVSYYVREGSPLDLEARLRGTSVYLVDRVIPMLPEKLSNGICSLNQGEDRLSLSIDMVIDSSGQVRHYEIFPSIIRVRTRLSYPVVRQILTDKASPLRATYQPLVPMLETMERLAAILRKKRATRGAIDFDLAELKVRLDKEGNPVAIEKRTRTVAESIIEEFMLAANETIASHLEKIKIPSLYRVHDDPDPEKMERLSVLLRNFGHRIGSLRDVKPMDLQQLLTTLSGRPEERMISTLLLRSLKQARYEAVNIGHFGLAARHYTHFTSPIRRYPDLIVHRLLRESLQGPLNDKRREKWLASLPKIAADSSTSERVAAEAERESVALKVAEFMKDHLGEQFHAIISGVTAFGLFVELENGVEGLVHVSTLTDDMYRYIEDQHVLLGDRHKKQYRMGDPVKVKLVRVIPEERTLDFVIAQNPASFFKASAPSKKSKEVKPIAPHKKTGHKNRRRKS